MLQQTQVQTVLPYYRRFMSRFPTVYDLAAAPLEDVLKAWENLGYYARARNVHAAARQIVEHFQGIFPEVEKGLLLLPGIGSYTAAAIASIAFGKKTPAIDGNVRRVLSRVFAVQTPIDQRETQKSLRALAETVIPEQDPGAFNQGLMDLGAGICTPRKPSCAACPLSTLCLAAIKGIQETLPIRRNRPSVPRKEMVAAILENGKGAYLVMQRPPSGLLGGLWGFPGGDKPPRKSREQALMDAVEQDFGMRVACGGKWVAVKHAYSHFRVTVHACVCRIEDGAPHTPRYPQWRWADPEALMDLPFSRVDRKIIQILSLI
jgi:A/G-specific adenine glycosylase